MDLYLLVVKTNEKVSYLVFLYHLISLNFLTYFSPMTRMTFLKYLFLLNLVTSNSPDFSTCLAIPFQSLLRLPLPQFMLLSVCTRQSPFIRSPWFSASMGSVSGHVLSARTHPVPAQTSLGCGCLQVFYGHFKFIVSTTELISFLPKLVLLYVPSSE